MDCRNFHAALFFQQMKNKKQERDDNLHRVVNDQVTRNRQSANSAIIGYDHGFRDLYRNGLNESQKKELRYQMFGHDSGVADASKQKLDRLFDSYMALAYPQEGMVYSHAQHHDHTEIQIC